MELERLKNQINLLKKAYGTLEDGLNKKSFSELEKDGIIQRFEYTIELVWKTCRIFLDYEKVNFLNSPRNILKECFKMGLIDDLELWNDFLDIRNSLSHLYSEYLSGESFEYINKNYKKIGLLINKFDEFLK